MVNTIVNLVKEGLPRISGSKRDWLLAHLCEPREIEIYSNDDRQSQVIVWAVTERNGENDGQYTLVYDPATNCFGLEMTSEDGTQWFMGPYSEDFAATVNMIS
jgi:hypothetical protein